ncbi:MULTISPECIES: TrmH family RNA methyltransferase [Caldanaerobacter]|uniref:tRNA (guanosine(18)-2'-O)-methyltransferase n=2 Tax=Caldanaerobacter subterraneus TaxID=911092 RepID=A0A4V2S7W3_9THEO|nr:MULTISPECIES: TrmH family RNA methyltransferase [Caldanaerobacter]KKC28601.1 rRNA methylase [Caldanaerobacter subterraneus subsp. pacificus DSM 12653]MBE3579413.1 tRNA (guanine-N2)-dimethyltransferase [Caldanaerobacter subterraneus]MDI3518610.1 tRNA (guanosine-2-O-)-methyltransferase [Caldanaerobacter sp.]TCO61530.1 tRNA (guanosine-2'-O-)-methyltransferase [Caldanaerobacter subterraneus]
MQSNKIIVLEDRLKRFYEVLQKRQKDFVVFVDDVTNEHNFSAILRTCDAVGVMRVYYFSEAKKGIEINEAVSMAANRWLFIERVYDREKAIKELKERENLQVVVTWLDESSKDFREIDYTKPTLLVVGNELKGVSEDILNLADERIVIPMMGMVQSLNVSVATGIILYEALRQRLDKGMYLKPTLSEKEIEEIIMKWNNDIIARRKERRK